MAFLVGQHVGAYEVISLIDVGGMGSVYRAIDRRLNRPVAIKVLSDTLANTEARRRFQREAQSASSLNYPHIVVSRAVRHSGVMSFSASAAACGASALGTAAAFRSRPHARI